jgi:hypothetical protein
VAPLQEPEGMDVRRQRREHRSNERHESETPCRKIAGTPFAWACSTYSIRTPVESDTNFVTGSSIPVPRDFDDVSQATMNRPARPPAPELYRNRIVS